MLRGSVFRPGSAPPEPPIDLRGAGDDPVAALHSTRGRAAILAVPGASCRGLLPIGFAMTLEANHPYILSAREYAARGALRYEGSPLEAYHQRVRPESVADVLGVNPNQGGKRKALLAPASRGSILPWDGVPGRVAARRIIKQMRKDLRKHGLDNRERPHWHEAGGPVARAIGETEISRIRTLVDSIRESGFIENHQSGTPITGTVLHSDDSGDKLNCVRIEGGQHRAAVLAALQYSRIPVYFRPERIVYRSRAGQWPAVRAGVLSKEQALDVFDRLIAARQPAFMQAAWPPRRANTE